MKYIITESQLDNIIGNVLPFIKRRMDRLDELVSVWEEITNTHECDEFEDGGNYVETVIGSSVMDFVGENLSNFEGDGATTKISLMTKLLSDRHYDRLVKSYIKNCGESGDN